MCPCASLSIIFFLYFYIKTVCKKTLSDFPDFKYPLVSDLWLQSQLYSMIPLHIPPAVSVPEGPTKHVAAHSRRQMLQAWCRHCCSDRQMNLPRIHALLHRLPTMGFVKGWLYNPQAELPEKSLFSFLNHSSVSSVISMSSTLLLK